MKKVLISFPITKLDEVQEIWKSIQTSACVSDSISAGARKHDFHYQKITQDSIRNTKMGTLLLSLLLACWATLGTSLHFPLCWHSVLLWSTFMWSFQRNASYHSWLAKTEGEYSEGQVTGRFRNSAVTAKDSSNYCPVFSTPFLNKCCCLAGQCQGHQGLNHAEQYCSPIKVTFQCLQYWFSAVSCQVLPPPLSDMRQLSRNTTLAPTPNWPAGGKGETGLCS